LTSVSIASGAPSAAPSAPATSVPAQPGLGVVVIRPQVGESRRTSIGPNEPIPRASSVPLAAKNSTARAIVSSGCVVGNVTHSRTSSGPLPVAQTHFVPPASTPP
jgi:hypothetical protein